MLLKTSRLFSELICLYTSVYALFSQKTFKTATEDDASLHHPQLNLAQRVYVFSENWQHRKTDFLVDRCMHLEIKRSRHVVIFSSLSLQTKENGK